MDDMSASISLNADGNASAKIGEVASQLTALGAQIAAFAGVSVGFTGLISAGIGFNKTMEDSRTGLGALIMSSKDFRDSTGEAASAQDALAKSLKMAEGVQGDLLTASLETAASYQQLVQAFQSAYGPGVAAGITNMSKLEKVVVSGSQAVSALGLNSAQTAQELRAMFTGEQGPDNILNRVLKITKADLEAVRAAGGDVGDFLLNKLAPFATAAAAATGNLSVMLSNLGDALDIAAGKAARPIFNELKSQISAAGSALKEFGPILDSMGGKAAEGLKAAMPTLTALGGVLLAASDAGLKFVVALSPMFPALTTILNVIAKVIDSLGPVGPALYVAFKVAPLLTFGASMFMIGDVATKTMVFFNPFPAMLATIATGFNAAGVAINAWATAAVASNATLLATLGLYGALAAALVGLAVAWTNWRDEVDKAEQSNAKLKDTTLQNLTKLGASNPAMEAAVKELKAKVEAVDPTDSYFGTENTKKLRALNAEYVTLARSARSAKDGVDAFDRTDTATEEQKKAVRGLLEEVETLKRSTREVAAAGLAGEMLKIDNALAAKLAKLAEKRKDIELGGADPSKGLKLSILDEIGQREKDLAAAQKAQKQKDHDREWLAEGRKFNDDMAALQEETAQVYLEGTVKEMAALDAKLAGEKRNSEERIVAAIDSKKWDKDELKAFSDNEAAKLDEMKKASEANKEVIRRARLDELILENAAVERDALRAEGLAIAAGMTDAAAAWEDGYKKLMDLVNSGTIKTQEQFDAAIRALDMKKSFSDPIPYAEKLQRELVTLGEAYGKGTISATEFARAQAKVNEGLALANGDGYAAAIAAIVGKGKDSAEAIRDYILSIWDAIGTGLQNAIYGLTSKTKSLGDALKGFFDSILQSFSKMVSEMVQKWIVGIFNMRDVSSGKALGTTAQQQANLGNAKVVVDSKGNIIDQGGISMSGAGAGLGIGTAVGSMVNGQTIQGLLTSLAGTIGGAFYGYLGAIVSSIVTALVGVLMTGQTETKQTISGTPDSVLAGTTLASIKNNAGIMSASFQEMFKAVDPAQAGEWTKQLNQMISDYIKGMSFQIHAGSDADFAADLRALVSGVIPKGLLAKFFGLVPGGDEVAGIKGSTDSYTGQFDPGAPIPKMLAGLGVTAAKIQEIAGMISTTDPDVLVKWLQQFVGIIVQAKTLVADLSKTGAELLADYEKTLHETDVEKLRTTVTGLVGRGAQIGDLSGQAQLDAASRLVTDIQAAFDQLQKSIAAIGQAIDDFSATVDNMAKQTEFVLLSADEQKASLMATAFGAAGKVAGAKTSDDAITAANEGLAAFQALLSTALNAIQALQQAIDSFTKTIDDILKSTADAMKSPAQLKADLEATAFGAAGKVAGAGNSADAITAANEGIAAFQALLTAALAWRQAAMDALATIDEYIAVMNGTAATYETVGSIQAGIGLAATMSGMEQVNQINKVGAAAMQMWQANEQQIKALADLAKSIKQSIADQIFNINLGEMDPKGQAQTIGDKMKELLESLRKATSGDEIQKLMSQIQSLGGQYLGQFGKDDPNRTAAIEWLTNFLKMAGDISDQMLKGMQDDLKSQNDLLRKALEDARNILAGNIRSAGDAIWQLTAGLTDLKIAITTTLKGYIDGLNVEIKDLIVGLKALRTGFDLAMTGFAQELAAAAAPLKLELDAMLGFIRDVNFALGSIPASITGPEGARAAMDQAAGAAGRLAAALDKAASAFGGGGSGTPSQSTSGPGSPQANVSVTITPGVDPSAVAAEAGRQVYEAVVRTFRRNPEVFARAL